MEIWLWSTQMAISVPAASREWPSSTLIATRQQVRQIFYPISSLWHHLVVELRTTLWQIGRTVLAIWLWFTHRNLETFVCFLYHVTTQNQSTCIANGGRGSPVFGGETDCTYYFDWETAFACVKEKEDLLCRVRDKNKHYDLSPLTRYPGEFACIQIFLRYQGIYIVTGKTLLFIFSYMVIISR